MIIHNLYFRNVNRNDFNFVLGLYKKNYFHYIEEMVGWDEVLEKERVSKDLRSGLDKIIMLNDTNAGYLSIDYFDDLIEIKQMSLVPRYQRKGIGTAIIEKIKSENKGIPLMIIIDKNDDKAFQFYSKVGFKAINEFSVEMSGKLERIHVTKSRMILPSFNE